MSDSAPCPSRLGCVSWALGPGPCWVSSRDLVGSGYRETYTSANGSEVTEPLQGQVGVLPGGRGRGREGPSCQGA